MRARGGKKIELDGYVFESRPEADRYIGLKALQRAGKIDGLEVHPKFEIVINGYDICKYTADFKYFIRPVKPSDPIGEFVIEDVKGFRKSAKQVVCCQCQKAMSVKKAKSGCGHKMCWRCAPVMIPLVNREFGMKAKLMLAVHGIEVQVV